MNSGIYEKASMQTGYRAAAIDVYKSMLAVVIAEVARHEQWPYQRRKFGATDSELRRLAALLREQGVREVILSSWVGACPGREESAQVSVSNRRPKGNRAMRRVLNSVANAAVKAKGIVFRLCIAACYPDWVTTRQSELSFIVAAD